MLSGKGRKEGESSKIKRPNHLLQDFVWKANVA